jgi:hypothetical protein
LGCSGAAKGVGSDIESSPVQRTEETSVSELGDLHSAFGTWVDGGTIGTGGDRRGEREQGDEEVDGRHY